MSLFLFTFFFLYAGMHYYAFLKAKTALAFGAGPGFAVAAFMVVMITSPFIVRWAEKGGWETFARIFAYVGYTWLGILFLFSSYAVAADLYRLFVHICGLALRRDLSQWALSAEHAFFLPLIFDKHPHGKGHCQYP